MRVGTLKEILKNVPDEYRIVFSVDAEHNYIKDPMEVSLGMYQAYPDGYDEGEFFEKSIIGNDEYDQPGPTAVNAVCLEPTN